MWEWTMKNNYPDYLQILCWNCNLGKSLNGGTCPHVTDLALFTRLRTSQPAHAPGKPDKTQPPTW